jgi:hypothetical protein
MESLHINNEDNESGPEVSSIIADKNKNIICGALCLGLNKDEETGSESCDSQSLSDEESSDYEETISTKKKIGQRSTFCDLRTQATTTQVIDDQLTLIRKTNSL